MKLTATIMLLIFSFSAIAMDIDKMPIEILSCRAIGIQSNKQPAVKIVQESGNKYKIIVSVQASNNQKQIEENATKSDSSKVASVTYFRSQSFQLAVNNQVNRNNYYAINASLTKNHTNQTYYLTCH